MKKKLIFLFTFIMVLINSNVWAQTKMKKASTEEVKTSFSKFYDRLRISYFGAYAGSSIGQWDFMALDAHGTKSPDSVQNLFNQVAFNYNFGAKLNFVVAPRWTANLASTSGHAPGNRGMLAMEDWLLGFQGVLFSSEDKKFNWWMRPALRLPTSKGSREADLTFVPEFANNVSYDFTKTFQLGMFFFYRHWVYQNEYNFERYRIYAAPFVQLSLNDTDRIQVWWENMEDYKDEVLKEVVQNVFVGYNTDVTPKLNLFPYVGFMLNTTYAYEKPLDATYLGAWISYQIK